MFCYHVVFQAVLYGDPLKVWRVINRFEGPKVHTIYEDTITWTINEVSCHPRQVEMPNYLYFPSRREQIISPQHWLQNATSAN